MSFLETSRFPDDISYGSRGGPVFKTAIAQMNSGHEQRSVQWAYPLHAYDVAYGVRTDAAVYTLTNFFMSVFGAAYGFRYKDWADYKSCSPASTPAATDASIGTGDFVTSIFQLKKTYTSGTLNMDRPIKKPVSATVSVAIDNISIPAQMLTVAYASGTVTIKDASAVVNGVSNANPAVVSATAHGLATGDLVHLTSIVGMVELNDRWFTVTNTGANTYSLNGEDSTAYASYVSDGRGGTLPQSGGVVTAGFEFDVPCRFESDSLNRSFEAYDMNSVDARVVEIRRGV